MRLVDQICEGYGAHNEDGIGSVGEPDDIRAAWVIDGVTGINPQHLIGRDGQTDAQWITSEMCDYLRANAAHNVSMLQLLAELVDHLQIAQRQRVKGLAMPKDYDYPAACLMVARPAAQGWEVMRLGDSTFVAEHASGKIQIVTSPGSTADSRISKAIHQRRLEGEVDFENLRLEFRSDFLASRSQRNRPGGYSIIEARDEAKHHAEVHQLDKFRKLLLCTDGFYRAVDHYHHCAPENFIAHCQQGLESVLRAIRSDEASDPLCERFARIKVGDDAAAILLEQT